MDKSKIRIAVVQYELRKISSFDDFAEQCRLFVVSAAGYKCDFILFPELITTQLLSYLDADDKTIGPKMTEQTERFVQLFSDLAREKKTYIIAGSHLTLEDGKLYNICYMFDRTGAVSKQYKLQITPHERNSWNVRPGDSVEVFDTDCGKISILICYDIEFPELSRVAASKGARIIFCPSNTDQRFGYMRVRLCAQARAIENQVYVAVSGCTGNTPMLGYGEIHYAQSAIFTPQDLPFFQDGVAAECAANVETMIIQDLDMNALEHHRTKGSVMPWSDRRTELYQVVYHDKTGDIVI